MDFNEDLPQIKMHNSYAKILYRFYKGRFCYKNCWYEEIPSNKLPPLLELPEKRPEYIWREVSLKRFKDVVFGNRGKLADLVLRVMNKKLDKWKSDPEGYDDFDGLSETMFTWKSLFCNKSSFYLWSLIEKECREVFFTEEEIYRKRYTCIHGKSRNFCCDC